MLYNDFFNSGDLFFHHKCLPSDEIGNGAIFRCAGVQVCLYETQTLFLCLTPTTDITNVAISQAVNQFAWNFARWKS